MKKIFDWTVGGFFRTIGRLFAFLVVGFLIGTILYNRIDFSNFKITDFLLFDKVYATSGGVWLGEVVSPANTWNYSSLSPFYVERQLGTFTTYTSSVQFETNFGQYGVDRFYFNGYIKGVDFTDYFTDCDSISGTTYTHCTWTNFLDDFQFQLWLGDNRNQCKIDYNNAMFTSSGNGGYLFWSAECFSDNYTTTNSIGYRLYLADNLDSSGSISSRNYYFGINREIFFSASDSQAIVSAQAQTTDAITNQTQQQQQQHQEIMDSNTTQAEDDASDFLGNFTVDDAGGLNAIITAPLSTIQSLLNNTCTKLVLPLPFVDKNIELPCLYPIYNEYFGAFFTIYQTIILGIVSYRCLKSLFFDIKGFTNPEDDRIEVMDL